MQIIYNSPLIQYTLQLSAVDIVIQEGATQQVTPRSSQIEVMYGVVLEIHGVWYLKLIESPGLMTCSQVPLESFRNIYPQSTSKKAILRRKRRNCCHGTIPLVLRSVPTILSADLYKVPSKVGTRYGGTVGSSARQVATSRAVKSRVSTEHVSHPHLFRQNIDLQRARGVDARGSRSKVWTLGVYLRVAIRYDDHTLGS
jgi:hypothetical protein